MKKKDAAAVVERWKRARLRGKDNCEGLWATAKKNHAFAAGGEGQWEEADLADFRAKRLPYVSVTKIPLILRTLSGRQIMQRFERQYLPRSRKHGAFAEMMTRIDRALMDRCDAQHEESLLFRNACGIQGVGWARVRIDTIEDPRGKIILEHVPVWNMMHPEGCTKPNLIDRPWQMHGSWWQREALQALYPGATLGNHGMPWALSDHATAHNRYVDGEPKGPNDPIEDGYAWVDELEWFEVATRYQVMLPFQAEDGSIIPYATALEQGMAPQIEEMTAEDLDLVRKTYQDGTREKLPAFAAEPIQRRVYRYAKMLGEELLETDESPLAMFSYEALTGFQVYKDDKWEWEGLVELLKDRQRLENSTWSSIIRMFQVNPKGALLVERGTFRTRNDAMSQWAAPGGIIEVERGKLSAGARAPFEFLGGVQMPAAQLAQSIMSVAGQSVTEGAGFNPASLGQLGQDLRRISGSVVQAVQDSAMVSNADLFDNLSLYRRRMGRVLLSMMTAYYEPTDLIEIVGEEVAFGPDGESKIPPKEMWRPEAWKAIAVQEAVPSPDSMAALWDSLAESGGLQILLQSGVLDEEMIAEIMPRIPEHLRERMREKGRMMVEARQMQMQAAQQQQAAPMPPGEGMQ